MVIDIRCGDSTPLQQCRHHHQLKACPHQATKLPKTTTICCLVWTVDRPLVDLKLRQDVDNVWSSRCQCQRRATVEDYDSWTASTYDNQIYDRRHLTSVCLQMPLDSEAEHFKNPEATRTSLEVSLRAATLSPTRAYDQLIHDLLFLPISTIESSVS